MNGESPLTDGKFCLFESILSLGAGISEFMYNCLLCFYIFTIVKYNLRGKKISPKYFHFFAITIIIGGLIYILCRN